MREEDERRIRASAPRAIRALEYLIETPTHKDFARGIEMVLSRVHPTESVHHVKVEHRGKVVIATEQVLERIRELASKAGLDLAQMPAMIDGEYEDITPATPQGNSDE
jgi:hypothetical protein